MVDFVSQHSNNFIAIIRSYLWEITNFYKIISNFDELCHIKRDYLCDTVAWGITDYHNGLQRTTTDHKGGRFGTTDHQELQ